MVHQRAGHLLPKHIYGFLEIHFREKFIP